VAVEQRGYKPYRIEVNTKTDMYLGDIVLAKARSRAKKTKS
jgi:hypothetical protein